MNTCLPRVPSARHRRASWHARCPSAILNLPWMPPRLHVSTLNNVAVIKSMTLIRVNLAKSGQKVFDPPPCHTNDYTHQGKTRLIKAKFWACRAKVQRRRTRPTARPTFGFAVQNKTKNYETNPQSQLSAGLSNCRARGDECDGEGPPTRRATPSQQVARKSYIVYRISPKTPINPQNPGKSNRIQPG